MVREKKYGLKGISKEENMRLRKRTEERLEIASAKENLWRRFRDKREELAPTGEKAEAWEGLKTSVMELEEEGRWREPGEEAVHLHKLTIRMKGERLTQDGQVQGAEGGHGGAEESKNIDRQGMSGEQHDGQDQGGVGVGAHGDEAEGGEGS